MSEYFPCLQEFIRPIPVCQSEADLGNMLNIFRHLDCENLAIPDRRGGWGIVRAQNLLSLVTEIWLGERIASLGHPRNAMSQQSLDAPRIARTEVDIETAIAYPADMKLTEFLTRLQYGSWFSELKVCLIVDRQGELLGQLDRNRLVSYLASELLSKPSPNVPFVLTYLSDLIDEIALPSQITTAEGQTVHANQQWQLLEPATQLKSPTFTVAKSDRDLERMTQKWIASQESIPFNCPACFDNCADLQTSDLYWRPQLETPTNNTCELGCPEFAIEEGADWNYLKIPLIDSASRTVKSEIYYLVLAIPALATHRLSSNAALGTAERSTNQILGAVSHELKSPLTGIVGLSNLLHGQKLGSLNQRQVRYVELIHRSGKKMMVTIENLLQLANLVAQTESEMEPINLEFLCRQLYQAIWTKVESLNANSESSLSFSQPKLSIELGSEIAIANKSRLSSLLSNLIQEAIAGSANLEPLQIQISNGRNGTTEIAMISDRNDSLGDERGLNFTLAEHLATTMDATVTSQTKANRQQLTLVLPKGEITPRPAIPESHADRTSRSEHKLTILCLYPELEVIDPASDPHADSNFDLKSFSDSCGLSTNYQHRLIEADSIEQAHNLARIWQIDAIILNGCQIANSRQYLRSLQEYTSLASLPLITLDTKTTEAANQIEGLNVFPCLLPSQCRSIEDLIQVIQIAIGS